MKGGPLAKVVAAVVVLPWVAQPARAVLHLSRNIIDRQHDTCRSRGVILAPAIKMLIRGSQLWTDRHA